MNHSHEIVAHYRAKGLRGLKLVAAVARHARILRALDPYTADSLDGLPALKLADVTVK